MRSVRQDSQHVSIAKLATVLILAKTLHVRCVQSHLNGLMYVTTIVENAAAVPILSAATTQPMLMRHTEQGLHRHVKALM